MVKITNSAIKQFRKMLSNGNDNGSCIRVFISGDGCCASYGIDVSEKGESGDKLIQKGDLKIYMEPGAFYGLKNARIDYSNIKKSFAVKGLSSCCG